MLPTITVIGNVSFMETKFTQSGKQVTSLVVSCSEKKKDNTWDNLNIKAEFWEKSAEFVNNYFNDGDVIAVTGKLITNSWQDQSGQKRNEIKFHFPQATFPPKSKNVEAPQQQQSYSEPQGTGMDSPVARENVQQQRPQTPPVIDIDEDEIPF